MKCIYKTLKSLDFMGDPMNFKINQSESFKTVFGGLLSFMIYLSFLYFFYLFGNDFIFKTNPTGYTKTEFFQNGTEKLSLKNETFFIALRLEDYYVKPLNFNEFPSLDFAYHEYNQKTFESKRTPLPAVKCNTLNLTAANIEPGIFDLSTYICPDFSKISTKSIYGDWNTEISSRLSSIYSITALKWVSVACLLSQIGVGYPFSWARVFSFSM